MCKIRQINYIKESENVNLKIIYKICNIQYGDNLKFKTIFLILTTLAHNYKLLLR